MLHNFVKKELVDECISECLLTVMENADKAYKKFRVEKFVDREKKLNVTIARQRLHIISHQSTDKHLAFPSSTMRTRHMDVYIHMCTRERTMEVILSLLFPNSPLFEGDVPAKHLLMIKFEKCLTQECHNFVPQLLIYVTYTSTENVICSDMITHVINYPQVCSLHIR